MREGLLPAAIGAPFDSIGSQFPREMDLPCDFRETTSRIQVLARFVLRHGFDHRISQTFAPEVIQSVFNELASQPLTTEVRSDGEIGNPALSTLAINQRRDVAYDPALTFGNEDSGGICRNVFIDVTCFAPAPVVTVQDAQRRLDVLFERHSGKRFDRQPFNGFQIVRPIITNGELRIHLGVC